MSNENEKITEKKSNNNKTSGKQTDMTQSRQEAKPQSKQTNQGNVRLPEQKDSGSGRKKSARKKARTDELIRKGLKRSSAFTFSLLVNIVIVFVVIKLFSYSFNFAYSVFGDVAKDPTGREYAVIEIPADSSTLQIGKALEDNGIIDDKYVFFAKVRIKNLGGKIKAGKYGLSSSMTYGQIINLICGINDEEEEE